VLLVKNNLSTYTIVVEDTSKDGLDATINNQGAPPVFRQVSGQTIWRNVQLHVQGWVVRKSRVDRSGHGHQRYSAIAMRRFHDVEAQWHAQSVRLLVIYQWCAIPGERWVALRINNHRGRAVWGQYLSKAPALSDCEPQWQHQRPNGKEADTAW
jgi:hypothetical protein